ncbi:MAG: hypothetical protein JW837_16005 [Sedimentisphaerales bacterium]|nr:hypothetical protein [Sedimentisphaerales bacterium]
MRNKPAIWLVLGLMIFGLFTVSVYRIKNTPSAIPKKDLVYGSISLPENIIQFAAEGKNGTIDIKPDKGIGKLPVGKYHGRLWKTERNDDQGNRWTLTGQNFHNLNAFEVNDSNQLKLDIGEPIICTVYARKSGSIYSFNQIIKGRLEEQIELTRNGSRPRAPKLNIKNKDGTYNRTFSFEYG